MRTSHTSGTVRRLAALGGIPILALVLGAGDLTARPAERGVHSGTPAPARRAGGRRAVERTLPTDMSEPATRCGTGGGSADATNDPVAPPPPSAPPPAGSREITAAGRAAPEVRGRTGDRRGNTRAGKPAGDGRILPRSKSGDPRRGGVGALIGITFA
jgi:hypothetical protein